MRYAISYPDRGPLDVGVHEWIAGDQSYSPTESLTVIDIPFSTLLLHRRGKIKEEGQYIKDQSFIILESP